MQIMRDVDKNGDNVISPEEFNEVMKNIITNTEGREEEKPMGRTPGSDPSDRINI